MKPEEYKLLFDVELRHWWYKALHRLTLKELNRQTPSNPPHAVDVGCGCGGFLSQLPSIYQRTGIDFSSLALGYAKQRGLFNTLQASTEAIPLQSACADVVFSMDVLYHKQVQDPHQAFCELARITKPEGLLLCNLPAYPWLRSAHDDAVETGRRYTRQEVKRQLQGTGWKIERLTHWNSLLFPLILAARVMRRGGNSSDLQHTNALEQGLGQWATGLERQWLNVGSFPFGLSIFLVARRESDFP